MTNMVWPDSLSAGLGVDTAGLTSDNNYVNEYVNEYVKQQIDIWNSWDEELKLILRANDMELEDLFLAVATQCDGHLIKCIIASVVQYDCCRLVRSGKPMKL